MTLISDSGSNDATPTTVMRSWMGQKTVGALVWNVVKEANRARPSDACSATPAMNKRGEILLGILTYAYATGLYRSVSIENELMSSPAAQSYFASAPITAANLRQFRRSNRELVKRCLRDLLNRVRHVDRKDLSLPESETTAGSMQPDISKTPSTALACIEPEYCLDEAAICDSIEHN